MSTIEKALWFLNGHYAQDIALEDVARAAGVSRHHLAHAFGRRFGISVMGYARCLRLSQAARELAAGAPDILGVALSAGYGSHEAFSRAFREQFGLTPDQLRAARSLDNLTLVTPMTPDPTPQTELQPPQFEAGRPLLVAGLEEHFKFADMSGIPALWQRFLPHIGHVPGQVGAWAYAVVRPCSDGIDYLCGVEVGSNALLPADLARVQVPAQRYAVFRHSGHVSTIGGTFQAILNGWLPGSGRQLVEAPFLERYGPEFDSRTGLGGIDILVPVHEAGATV